MPSDFLTAYRHRFRAFHTSRNRADYLFYSGQQEKRETKFLYSEYSDLFSTSALAELHKEWAATASYRETERAALSRLIAQASHENFTLRVRALTEEIHTYESRAIITWEDSPISFHAATTKLRNEPDARKRLDLSARCTEVIKGAQDLRAERLAQLHTAAREAGHENYLATYQALRGIAYENLAAQLQQFLTQTASKYVSALVPLLVREAHVTRAEATRADLSYFQQLTRFDKHFPAWQLKHAYRATFSGLGIFTYKQDSVVIDDEPRPHKSAQSFHFPIQVPGEIKVVFTPRDGARKYASFLHEVGHAQQFAWTSQHLYPEFQFADDGTLREGFALLFASLLAEERWLGEMLSFSESHEFRHLFAVQKLLLIRRYAAKLNYEVELHTGKLAHTAGARYSELLTDAVRVRYDETEHLRDLEDGFATADYLRACAFEAQLREQLKTKFGSRWWTARKAGDYLIDLWNTGGRYQADVMAKMIDLGELSFDWLAEECLTDLS